MKIKNLITLIFVLSIHSLYAQDYEKYYNVCNEALTCRVQKDYQKAIQLYNKAFDLNFPFPEDVKHLKNCYDSIGDTENAYKAMQLMVKCGYKLYEHVPFITDYKAATSPLKPNITQNPLLQQKIEEEYDSLRKEYLKQVDKDIGKYLSVFTITEAFASIMRWQFDSESYEFAIVQQAGFGTELNFFMNLLRSGMDLPRHKTDTWSDFLFIKALVHMALSVDDSNSDDFFDLLKVQVKKGNLNPATYGNLYDQPFSKKDEPAYYGFALKASDPIEPKDLKIADVYDPETIDERRKEISLPPLWVWCKLYNIQLPENYSKNEIGD